MSNSFIELYLTVFGWILYDNFWAILSDTGIAYLPFIGVLAKNFVEPYTSQNERDASVTSIKRMEVDIFSMLTVIVLAAQPFLPISVDGSSAVTACSGGPVTGGATGSTYDTVFSAASIGGQQAAVPIWWMAVIHLSAGVTNAGILAIPCDVDLRQLRYEFDNEKFTDPETYRQIVLFFNDCWAPARAYFSSSNDTLPAGTDPSEINWIGSQTFLDNGYYDRYQAKQAIPGFPFQATATANGGATGRDSAYYNTTLPKPQWGYPLCSEWWSDPLAGLRARILGEADPALLNEIITVMTGQGLGTTQAEDLIVRGLTANEETLVEAAQDGSNAAFLSGGPGNLAGAVGAKIEQITLIPKVILLKQAAPIVQALLLMLLYTTLPFILLFSAYSIGTVITVSIILFAVKFLSVFWTIATWLDTNLQKAILIGQGRADVASRFRDFILKDGLLDTVNKDILDLSLAILYVVVPLFWVFALGLAGLRAGRGISDFISGTSGPVGNAGEKGGGAAAGAGKKIATKGAGKLGKK